MKITTLFDQGTAKDAEDMFWMRAEGGANKQRVIAVVADGVSGLYLPEDGPRLFYGRTGGQMVCDAIRNAISSAGTGGSIDSLLTMANIRVWESVLHHKLDMQRSDLLPGAAFAIVRIDEEKIDIVQGADCIVVWQKRNGTVNATKNQVFDHDSRLQGVVARLMAEHHGNRQEVWREFTPILSELRLRNVNRRIQNGYAMLNGQEGVLSCRRRVTLSRRTTRRLIISSDGLVPLSDTQDNKFLARIVMKLFAKGGLPFILARTREIEEKEKETSHIDNAEATAIAIENL